VHRSKKRSLKSGVGQHRPSESPGEPLQLNKQTLNATTLAAGQSSTRTASLG
jgi:hypothetical protein